MDLSILFTTNALVGVAHFCIVFPQQRFFQRERMLLDRALSLLSHSNLYFA